MLAGAMMRSGDEIRTYTSKWTVGASGAHTRDANVPGRGFDGIARTAAGKYTTTFAKGVVGELVGYEVTVWRTADAAPLTARPTKTGYTAAVADGKATMLWETFTDAGVQTEIASGDLVTVRATFLKTR